MKTIIAGSRGINDYRVVKEAIEESGFTITEIVSGGARGVDRLGEKYAEIYNIPVRIYPANWDRWGKCAGMIRNADMAKDAEALIAIWDGESKGTFGMIRIAETSGLRVYIKKINKAN